MNRFDYRWSGVTHTENFRLSIPKVRFAVHGTQTLCVDHRRAVGQFITFQPLAKTADHDQVQFTGERRP
ncbi:hypothetical protein D3C73_1552160 [compost metagenome]